MMRFSISIALIITLSCAVAYGQETPPKPAETEPPKAVEEVKKPSLAAPYDKKLMRLAEVLGSIHHLRNLCGAKEGNKWRDQMSQILVAEEPDAARKKRLIARFNRGYRAFQQNYATCTDSAVLATERYMKEGVFLSSQITARFGR